MNYKIISIPTVPTQGMGSLSFFEAEETMDFPIRRIYYIHGVEKDVQRGAHAHRALKQLLVLPVRQNTDQIGRWPGETGSPAGRSRERACPVPGPVARYALAAG